MKRPSIESGREWMIVPVPDGGDGGGGDGQDVQAGDDAVSRLSGVSSDV